jgi:arsenate reductase
MKKSILVLCVHNSSRSQMAEEYIRAGCGGCFEVESAGIEPGTLNPYVVRALAEDGIDIAGKGTQSVFDLHARGKTYDFVIAVCSKEAEEQCPIFPGTVRRLHWPFDDPKAATGTEKEILSETRRIRDQIKAEVRRFCSDYCGD